MLLFMKKLLGIIILGLLLSGNAYAIEFKCSSKDHSVFNFQINKSKNTLKLQSNQLKGEIPTEICYQRDSTPEFSINKLCPPYPSCFSECEYCLENQNISECKYCEDNPDDPDCN